MQKNTGGDRKQSHTCISCIFYLLFNFLDHWLLKSFGKLSEDIDSMKMLNKYEHILENSVF